MIQSFLSSQRLTLPLVLPTSIKTDGIFSLMLNQIYKDEVGGEGL
jgi:hypothetical protein